MAVILDGSTQYLYRNNNIVTSPPFTVSAFFKSTSDSALQAIWGTSNGADTDDFWRLSARGSAAGDPVACYAKRSVGSPGDAETSTGYTTGTWHHAAFIEAGAQDHRVYIDANSVGTDTTNSAAPVDLLYNTIGVLRYNGGWANYFAGKLLQVAIWNIILSTDELEQLKDGADPTTIQPANLVAYWPLLSDAEDDIGVNNMTAVGTPTYDSDSPTFTPVTPTDKTYSRKLIAVGNNEVWQEATAGTMSQVSGAAVNTANPLNIAVVSQKAFIANGTVKKVLDYVNTKITTSDVNTYPPDFGIELTGGTSGAKMIVDYINASTADAACTIYGKRSTAATFANGETVTGTNPSTSPYAGSVTFVLSAAETAPPHWYDYTVFGDDATNYGIVPDSVNQVCKYRGRVQWCGDPVYPHQWYQSRQFNPFDLLYVAGNAQSPVAGNDADATEVGDIVVTAIPYHDDYMIYGCANELWYLSGDAAFGGELNILDDHSGILGDRAWCWDNDKRLYLMCTSGLLRIPVGFQAIENLTSELWPDWVKDLAFDSSLHRIVLAFNPEDRGIHIFKTILSTGVSTAWWYDLRTEGLFPDAIPDSMGVYSAHYYKTQSPSYRKLLFGCADGYMRFMDPDTKNDDSTAIDSYVGFAPLSLSTHPRKDGKLTNIDIVTGGGGVSGTEADSDDVYCKVHVARTAAKVIEKLDASATPKMTKTFSAPGWSRSNIDRRSVRGQWGGIVVGNSTATESWSMERLIVDTKEIGRSL